MAKREGQGRRCYTPVMRRVVEHKEDQSHRGHIMPGRWGKRWEYEYDGLSKRAAYDPESMAMVQRMGGLKRLINTMFPTLNPERKLMMLSDVGKMISRSVTRDKRTGKVTRRVPGGVAAIIQAKKKEYDQLEIPALVPRDKLNRRRRWSKKEKRKHYDARDRLRALLKRSK